MRVQANNIEEFLTADPAREGELREADAFVQQHTPHMKREFFSTPSMTFIGYGISTYTYASGQTGEWPIVALAPQKHTINLYLAAVSDNEYYAEKYADQLGKVSVGRSCVRIKKWSDVDKEGLAKVLAEIDARYHRGDVLYGV